MTALVRAELRKLATRKLTWALLLIAGGMLAVSFVLVPLLVTALPAKQTMGLEELVRALKGSTGPVYAAQQAANTYVPLLVILGAIATGTEFSQGTMSLTLTLEPRRARVLAAKAVALLAIAGVSVLALCLEGLVLVAAIQPLIPESVEPIARGSWPLPTLAVLAGGLPGLVAWACASLLLGVTTRNAAAAAGLGVGWYFAESLLGVARPVQAVLVSANTGALQQQGGLEASTSPLSTQLGGGIPAWRALVVLAAYAGLAFALAAWDLRRRDVLA